jgi:hypothetical protein
VSTLDTSLRLEISDQVDGDGAIRERYKEVKPVEQQTDIHVVISYRGVIATASLHQCSRRVKWVAGGSVSSLAFGSCFYLQGARRCDACCWGFESKIIRSGYANCNITSIIVLVNVLQLVQGRITRHHPARFLDARSHRSVGKGKNRAPLPSTDARRPITTPSKFKTCLCLIEQVLGSLQQYTRQKGQHQTHYRKLARTGSRKEASSCD